MSRPLIAFLGLPVLAATLAAQQPPPPEGIQIFPASGFSSATASNGGSYATRLSFGPGTGEGVVHYPKTHFEGIGDSSVAGGAGNPTCRLDNFSIYLQDQNGATAHNISLALRPAATGGGPDTNNNNALWVLNTTTPVNPAGPGAVVWRLWWPVSINATIPCKADLFFGVKLNANTNWPTTDGLSYETAFYDPIGQAVPTRTGDAVAPRTGVLNLCWEINASGVASQPTIPQVLNYVLISPYSMIQVGVRHKSGQSNHGSNDGFGVASLFPSISGGTAGRQDGCIVRITDNPPVIPPATTQTFGGQYLLFLALSTGTQLQIPPLHLNGLFGNVYLGPIGQFALGGGSLSTTGSQTIVLIAPPGVIPPAAATQNVKVYFEAATTRVGSAVVAITNLAGVYY